MTSRTATRIAIALDVVVAFLFVVGVVLTLANRPDFFDPNAAFLLILFGATAAAYAVTGTMIARRQPSNPIAWLFLAMAVFLVYGVTATEYAVYALRTDPGSLPAAATLLVLAEPTQLLFMVGLILVLFVFPTGRTTGRLWRVASWTTVIAVVVASALSILIPHTITDVWADRLSLIGLTVRSPLGLEPFRGLTVVVSVAVSIILLGGLFGAASLFARRRRADAATREQLRWLAYVVGASTAWIVVVAPIAVVANSEFVFSTSAVITPLVASASRSRSASRSCAIACTTSTSSSARPWCSVRSPRSSPRLRRRWSLGSGRWSAQATSQASRCRSSPLRWSRSRSSRCANASQRFANRLVYGKRATPYEVLVASSPSGWRVRTPPTTCSRGWPGSWREGTGATEADVWLALRDASAAARRWPEPTARQCRSAASRAPDVDRARSRRSRCDTRASCWARSRSRKPAGEPLTPAEEQLVADLAAQAGLVLRNVRLIEDAAGLRASGSSQAQDEERRRIERNIHDGAQQQLVALAVKLGLARAIVGQDEEKAHDARASCRPRPTEALETPSGPGARHLPAAAGRQGAGGGARGAGAEGVPFPSTSNPTASAATHRTSRRPSTSAARGAAERGEVRGSDRGGSRLVGG